MEIETELTARNRIYLHTQITVRTHQSSFLSIIKAFSPGIKRLDDEVKNSIPSDANYKIYSVSPFSYALQRHDLIKHKTTVT